MTTNIEIEEFNTHGTDAKPHTSPCAAEAQEQSNKPRGPLLWAFVAIFLAVMIADNILWDLYFNNRYGTASKWSIPAVFFLDAIGRILVSLPIILFYNPFHLKEIFANLTLWNYISIFGARFLLGMGFLIGIVAIKYIGSGTKSVMMQTQLGLVAVFRYFITGDSMTYQQIIHACAIVFLAMSFKADNFSGGESENYGMGMLIMSISCILVSAMFATQEILLKDVMKKLDGWDKQLVFAVIDIPISIPQWALSCCWEIYGQNSTTRTFNPIEHMNWLCVLIAVNCVLFGLGLYFMFDWVDSVFVSLLFVLAMGLTWPLEVFLEFEQFSVARLLILFGLVICSAGYLLDGKMKSRMEQEALEKFQEAKTRDSP